MADALTQDAPLKKRGRKPSVNQEIVNEEPRELTKEEKALAQKFNPNIKYMFELASKVPPRDKPVMIIEGGQNGAARPERNREFPKERNLVFTSQIVWNGERRILRYYDGCKSLFTEDQPQNKEVIDQLIRQTKRRKFVDGKFGCFGDERMLLLYMNLCSWNVESEFRTRTADAVFRPINKEKQLSAESHKLDEQERALQLAKDATISKMKMHSYYLGIPQFDYESGNDYTDDEIRVEYRKAALQDPTKFIESYGNKKLELRYYIDKALEKGLIHNKFNINRASWQGSNAEICDVSGLRTNEAIGDRLFEFACGDGGEEFSIQLKGLFN